MSEAKTKLITIKFSQTEYQNLLQKASLSNLPLATYARERVLFDTPKLEQQSFEFKMLKGISYCVGMLSAVSELKLSDEELDWAQEEIFRIMKINGINQDLLPAKTNLKS